MGRGVSHGTLTLNCTEVLSEGNRFIVLYQRKHWSLISLFKLSTRLQFTGSQVFLSTLEKGLVPPWKVVSPTQKMKSLPLVACDITYTIYVV